jgi:Phage portal protein
MGLIKQVKDFLAHAANYNPFANEEDYRFQSWGGNAGYGRNPSATKFGFGSDKTVITSIYNQIAIDVAAIPIQHVKLDDEGRFKERMTSGLNTCLSLEANIDQGGRAFRQNIAMTLFDKGVAAICIMEATEDPAISMAYDIQSLRVGEVVAWFPEHVRVLVYNQNSGNKEELTLPKRQVAIIENPLYAVMNDDNSTLKRLTRKLSLLDAIDEQAGSGKLDIIIQLPYVVKSESRKQQAAARRQDMEEQLYNSKYGVAYADATEKITQLNRPAENNMLAQVEFLTKQLYSQLGITKDVFEGTADEKMLINYNNRTVEPILTAIAEGIERKFLSKTARSQGQAMRFFRDPFKNATLADIAEIADKLSRNEVVTSNEIRGAIGFKPSTEAKADKLQNSNMPNEDNVGKARQPSEPIQERKVNLQNDSGNTAEA